MSFLPKIAEVQAVAADDAFIQGLTAESLVWILVTKYIDKTVTETVYGPLEFEAQLYLAAHMLSLANQPVGGRGPLSSESVGGVSHSFTLPYLNQKTVIGSTQFGLMFMEIKNQIVVPFAVITI